jgi:hypothetical protein
MGQKASGNLGQLGLLIDGPSGKSASGARNYSVGHPGINVHQVTAPITAPTAAAGSAGNLTGEFLYRIAFGQPDGKLTNPGPTNADTFAGVGPNDLVWSGKFTGDAWVVTIATAGSPDHFTWTKNSGAASVSTAITGLPQLLSDGVYVTFAAVTGHTLADAWTRHTALTLSAKIATISVIPTSADLSVDRRVIERGTIAASGVVSWAVCGTVYDRGTTNTFSDNVAVLDASFKLPSVNQTGSNGGAVFLEANSFDLEPLFSVLPVNALIGSAGQPRGVPGPIKLEGAPKADLRLVDLFPFLVTGAGEPDSIVQTAGEPTQVVTWNATTARRSPRSASALGYKGSPDVPPIWFWQGRCSELSIAFASGKITDITPKFTFCNYGSAGLGTKVAGTGTWSGTFVLMGQRFDSMKDTEPLRIQITQALSASTVKIKVTRGSGGSYSGAAQILYADSDGRQTKGGAQFNDGLELLAEDGTFLGAFVKSNRQPLLLYATAPFTTDLHVGDTFEFPLTQAIPDAGVAPYSGFPATRMNAPRLTGAHVTLSKDGSVIEATSGTLTFKFSSENVEALGPGNRTIQDLPNSGFNAVEASITHFLDSPDWVQSMAADDRVEVLIALGVEPMPVNPGVISASIEGLYTTIPQFVLSSVKSPVGSPKLIPEAISGYGEQPSDSSRDLFEIVANLRNVFSIPA